MALEDFKNDYIELDPAAYINADTANTRVDFVNMITNAEIYFSKDFGAAHFGNYTHFIEFYLDAAPGSSASLCGYAVAGDLEGIGPQLDAFQVHWQGESAPVTQRIYIQDPSDESDDHYNGALDTLYYLKVIRNGTTWSVEIYTGGKEDTLVDTIATTGTATAFRYIQAGQNNNTGGSNRDITGYMQNLDLQEAAPGGTDSTVLLQHMARLRRSA